MRWYSVFQHRHRYDRTSPVLCSAEVSWKAEFISRYVMLHCALQYCAVLCRAVLQRIYITLSSFAFASRFPCLLLSTFAFFRLLSKFQSQLEQYQGTGTGTGSGDMEPFSITIDFGHTLFINTEAYFDTLSPCVTVLEMENALHTSRRSRTSPDRPAFTLQPPVRDKDKDRDRGRDKDKEREEGVEKEREREREREGRRESGTYTSTAPTDFFSYSSTTPVFATTPTPTPASTPSQASVSGAHPIQVNEQRRLSFERAGFDDEGKSK